MKYVKPPHHGFLFAPLENDANDAAQSIVFDFAQWRSPSVKVALKSAKSTISDRLAVSRLGKAKRCTESLLGRSGRRRRPDKPGKVARSVPIRPLSAQCRSRQARSPTVFFLHCGAVHRFQDSAQNRTFRFSAQKPANRPEPPNHAETATGSQCCVLSGPMSGRRGAAGLSVQRFRTQCIGFGMPPLRSASFLCSVSTLRRPPRPPIRRP